MLVLAIELLPLVEGRLLGSAAGPIKNRMRKNRMRKDRMLSEVRIVPARMVFAEMRAAAFGAGQGGEQDGAGDGEQGLRFEEPAIASVLLCHASQ